MNLSKKIIATITTAVMLFNCCIAVFAFDRKEHDKYMKDVLFKYFKIVDNDKSISKEIEALSCASYLAIDQYNGHGKDELITLKDYGVKKLPSSISEIDYNGGPYHRKKTHRGWNAENGTYFGKDSERWITRKAILLNTADKMFDFDNKNQKDSFCALIYYIHILSDRIADDKYYENAVIMELGGRTDKQDITHELITNIEVLFSDQKHTFKYQHVISKIESYDSKISELSSRTKGIYKNDDFKEYQEYANGIMEVLMYNIPEMLKDEKFFNEVFY